MTDWLLTDEEIVQLYAESEQLVNWSVKKRFIAQAQLRKVVKRLSRMGIKNETWYQLTLYPDEWQQLKKEAGIAPLAPLERGVE